MRTLFRERGWFSGPHASPRVWEARKHDHTLERCVAVRIHHTGPEHRRSVARLHRTPCASVRVCISGKLQPWVKCEAEKLKRTSALRPVRLQLAQQQWQKHFFPMTTKHDSSQLEAKRNKKALVAHVSPTFCNLSISVPSHARLTCDMSTGKQRRRTTRRINAQCELSEGIWGSNVSVKWRVRKCCCEVTQTFMLKQN